MMKHVVHSPQEGQSTGPGKRGLNYPTPLQLELENTGEI